MSFGKVLSDLKKAGTKIIGVGPNGSQNEPEISEEETKDRAELNAKAEEAQEKINTLKDEMAEISDAYKDADGNMAELSDEDLDKVRDILKEINGIQKELQEEGQKVSDKYNYKSFKDTLNSGARIGYSSSMDDEESIHSIYVKRDGDKSFKTVFENDLSYWDPTFVLDLVQKGNLADDTFSSWPGNHITHAMGSWPNVKQSTNYLYLATEQRWYYKDLKENTSWTKIERPIPKLNNKKNLDLI